MHIHMLDVTTHRLYSPTHHYLPLTTWHAPPRPTYARLLTTRQFVRFLEGDRAALSEHLTDQQQQLGQLQAPIVSRATVSR